MARREDTNIGTMLLPESVHYGGGTYFRELKQKYGVRSATNSGVDDCGHAFLDTVFTLSPTKEPEPLMKLDDKI